MLLMLQLVLLLVEQLLLVLVMTVKQPLNLMIHLLMKFVALPRLNVTKLVIVVVSLQLLAAAYSCQSLEVRHSPQAE